MNPDLTINPNALSASLDGLTGLDRIACIREWISAACACCSLVTDTTLLLNGSASVLFLYRMLDDACCAA